MLFPQTPHFSRPLSKILPRRGGAGHATQKLHVIISVQTFALLLGRLKYFVRDDPQILIMAIHDLFLRP
jgi:hypothetical protein